VAFQDSEWSEVWFNCKKEKGDMLEENEHGASDAEKEASNRNREFQFSFFWLCCKNEGVMINASLFGAEQRSSHHDRAASVQMASFPG
jgi:hypothetical protein